MAGTIAADPDPEYHRRLSDQLTDQLKALDAKWTREFRGVKTTINGVRAAQLQLQQAQDHIQTIHGDQSSAIASLQREAALIAELKEEVGRLKPLTKEEQQALGQLVSKQLASQIIHQWIGSLKGKLIAFGTAAAIFVTLASSIKNLLFPHIP